MGNTNQLKRYIFLAAAASFLLGAVIFIVLAFQAYQHLPVQTPSHVVGSLYLHGLGVMGFLWLFLKAMARAHLYACRLREDIITHLPYLFDRV